MPLPARPLLLLLFIGALAAAAWRAPTPAATTFTPPPAAQPSALPAQMFSEMLWRDPATAAAPQLGELPDGRLAAVWLAGPEDDMSVHFSIRERAGWRPPVQIASQASTASGVFAQVGALGKPVIQAEGSWLHLWYASSTLGSSINHSVSTDGGKTWSKPARLPTSPVANFGGAVSGPPLPLADGGLGLPTRHDFIGHRSAWLRLAPTGQIIDKILLPGTPPLAIAVLDDQQALAILGTTSGLRTAMTSDAGRRWQVGAGIDAINPQAPVALLRLSSGRLLLAGNAPSGRQALLLWLSADRGLTWQAMHTVEAAPDGAADFGNPALLLGRDGRIHLAYDWRRQGIKHVVFSEAWLDEKQP